MLPDRPRRAGGDAADAASVNRSIAVPDERVDPGRGPSAAIRTHGSRAQFPRPCAECFESLSTTGSEQQVADGEAYAVLARPFKITQGAHGVMVLAKPLRAVRERTAHAALLIRISAGALIVLLAVGDGRVDQPACPRTVQQSARTAAEWSDATWSVA